MGEHKREQEFLSREVAEAIRAEKRPLLFATFNTYRVLPNRECRSRGERMFYSIDRRCFRGASYAGVPTRDLIRIIGALERGHHQPHLHTLVWLTPSAVDTFVRVASSRWQAVSPGGAVHLQVVSDPQGSANRLASYLTKDLDRRDPWESFFTEAELGLPEFGGPIRRRS